MADGYSKLAPAQEPMPNFSSTPGGPNDTPLAFWADWELGSRPRRVALLMDDVQVNFYKCPFGSML
jgi:hypothetical protein